VGGSAHVGGQGMALLIGRKGVLEDRLQRDERHRCLRTSGRRASLGCFAQYHANYPRCKRLVQPTTFTKRTEVNRNLWSSERSVHDANQPSIRKMATFITANRTITAMTMDANSGFP